MEIEIITTKKKLTKSILRQMWSVGYNDFEKAIPLGYIRNIYRDCGLHILCKIDNEYSLLNALWEHRGKKSHRQYAGYNLTTMRGEFQKGLKVEIIDDWFEKYNALVKKGKELGQIFI